MIIFLAQNSIFSKQAISQEVMHCAHGNVATKVVKDGNFFYFVDKFLDSGIVEKSIVSEYNVSYVIPDYYPAKFLKKIKGSSFVRMAENLDYHMSIHTFHNDSGVQIFELIINNEHEDEEGSMFFECDPWTKNL